MKMNAALLSLAVGAFGIGVTEFSPMGMLPVIANDLGVSIPTAGLLISAYAIGVLIGAPIMTLGFSGMARRKLLLLSMAIFTIGNLLSAMADSYLSLLLARVITSFNHGAFFGVGAVVATQLVPPHQRAAAVAMMFSGLTIANIGGVPLATFVGDSIGWRPAFFGIAMIGVITMLALYRFLPALDVTEKLHIKDELKVLSRRPVLIALLLTVVSASSMFTVFTYIAPILLDETGVSSHFVTAMLVIFGLGMTVGNIVGGRYADKSLYGTLLISMLATTALLLAFAVFMQSKLLVAPIIFLWGVASFALVPPLQTLVVQQADGAPNLSSSMNIGAFNLGNATGAALGGWVIHVGLGLPMVALAGALTTALGLVMLWLYRRRYAIPQTA